MSPEEYLTVGTSLKWLLGIAWLLPLLGFAIEIFGGYWGTRRSRTAAWLAVGCIATGFVCSTAALVTWGNATDWGALAATEDAHAAHDSEAGHGDDHDAHAHAAGEPHDHHAHPEGEDHAHDSDHAHAAADHDHAAEHHAEHANDPFAYAFSGTYYRLATFGRLSIAIDYYIDGLTLVMFVMVTLIATCIHIFAVGYMSDELTDDYADHFVHLPDGRHLHRPGRFYRFFAFMSLFCFSMLGLVLAGNIFQVFVFWELVGVCSYLLIGFYVERHSASTAANKAFIMNRVGDFGFLIGLMILWTWFGTFQFANVTPGGDGPPGLFQMVRDGNGQLALADEGNSVLLHDGRGRFMATDDGQPRSIPYFLLVAAGLGIFAGCIGKSAQFPLQTWLPDAMEGPTPVSALVHSATMVAAGVYLAGRFYPLFTPEVLLTIAYIGCITLFLGATIAVVATDIKRVLAYSTISQLGYMMLALGVGGWLAGLFHLVTHAFFKSLLFLCSGSVIHGCHHEQEMTKMGGLRTKMPITAGTMLIGVIAICGLAIPGTTIAFSGFYSKDAIVASGLTFMALNSGHLLLFIVPLVTAGITAFYMFRLWFMTFAGPPRDEHVYEHAHESPWIMTAPLVVLALFAAGVAWGGGETGPLASLILSSEPAHVGPGLPEAGQIGLNLPGHGDIHQYHQAAGTAALIAAFAGLIIAFVFYGSRTVDPALVQRQFPGLHAFLVDKWQFDRLYDAAFVNPVRVVASWCQEFDRKVLDGVLHAASHLTVAASRWDRLFDEAVVDRLVNIVGNVTFGIGSSFQYVQTGRLRQYVMFIALGVVSLFILVFAFFPR